MILERLKQYIDFKGITVAAFERSIGMANSSFRKSLKNSGAIGTDKLENILIIYPDLSPIWLLKGEGDMIINGEILQPTKEAVPAYLLTMISEKDALIQKQAKEIGKLEQQLAELKQRFEKDVEIANIGNTANAG